MKFEFTEKRPNGKPIDRGTFAGLLDLEDGSHPIYAYGATKDEVYEKLVVNGAHARVALNRVMTPPVTPAGTTPVGPKPDLTPEQVMQRTTELGVAGKAGAAARVLIEDETGLDLHELAVEKFARVAMDWRRENPNFYNHPGNRKLLTERALALAGGKLGRVTKEFMTQAYNELLPVLFQDPEPDSPIQQPDLSSTTFPGASPVQRAERTETPLFATAVPGNRLRASQAAPPKTPKYTEAAIRNMPEKERVRLIQVQDKDFNEACEVYFGQKTA